MTNPAKAGEVSSSAKSIGSNQQSAIVVVEDIPEQSADVELSILFDEAAQSASLLNLSLRARIVRSCSSFFLNTRTIRQTAPIAEGVVCTLEVEIKSNGSPVDELLFELQHRGCSSEDPWQFGGVGKTGTSGPGVSEIDFIFRNDEKHCVSRVIGPIGASVDNPLSAQIHTLRKQQFD